MPWRVDCFCVPIESTRLVSLLAKDTWNRCTSEEIIQAVSEIADCEKTTNHIPMVASSSVWLRLYRSSLHATEHTLCVEKMLLTIGLSLRSTSNAACSPPCLSERSRSVGPHPSNHISWKRAGSLMSASPSVVQDSNQESEGGSVQPTGK